MSRTNRGTVGGYFLAGRTMTWWPVSSPPHLDSFFGESSLINGSISAFFPTRLVRLCSPVTSAADTSWGWRAPGRPAGSRWGRLSGTYEPRLGSLLHTPPPPDVSKLTGGVFPPGSVRGAAAGMAVCPRLPDRWSKCVPPPLRPHIHA